MSFASDIDDRLIAAAIKAEGGSEIIRLVANGPENSTVPSESGPIPTLLEWQRIHAAELGNLPALEADVTSLKASRTALANPATGTNEVGYGGGLLKDYLDQFVVLRPKSGDRTADLTAAKALAITTGKTGVLMIPGKYDYDGATFNWAAADLLWVALGLVELHSTTAGVAYKADAGNANWYRFKMLGNFIVTGNASSTDGVFIRGMHHARFDLRAHDIPGTAFVVNYGVRTKYNFTCTDAGRPFVITPTKGLTATIRNTGEYVADSEFDLTLELINGPGADLVNVHGCKFKGTSEGNAGYGVQEQAACRDNIFDRFWCELNGSNDFILRSNATLLNCHAGSSTVTNNVHIEGRGAKIYGGAMRCINRDATCADVELQGVEVSDNASLGIKGGGVNNKVINCVKTDVNGNVTGRYTDVLGDSGTFLPTFFGTGGGTAHTYSSQVGYYQKIGGRLNYEIVAGVTTKDATMTGPVSIGGLPLLSNADANRVSIANMGNYNLITTTTARPQLSGRILPNTQAIQLFISGPGVGALQLDSAAIVNGSSITISGSIPLA
jgi:hypothetical protein